MKKFASIAGFGCLVWISGCIAAPPTAQKCMTAVKYSGYELDITGLQLGTYKLAGAAWKPVQLQQATALTQALDIMQFGDCQLAQIYGSDSAAGLAYLSHRTDVVTAMETNAKAFSAATTAQEATQAVNNAQANVDSLAANTPKAGAATQASSDSTKNKAVDTSTTTDSVKNKPAGDSAKPKTETQQ
jgi:hypothetical protein